MGNSQWSMVNGHWRDGEDEDVMRSNGYSGARAEAARTEDSLGYVTWATGVAVALPSGAVHASGDASPQVRSPQRLAAAGDIDTQIEQIQRVIVDALAGALTGMAPAVDDLLARRDEIASLTLVAANMQLSALGVSLLDLRIVTLEHGEPSP
jgi:enolase